MREESQSEKQSADSDANNRARDLAAKYFGSFYALSKYLGAQALGLGLLQIALVSHAWWLTAGMVALLVFDLCRPTFRFLWATQDWFRVLTVLHGLIQLGFGISAVISSNSVLGAIGVIASLCLLLLAYPAMTNFCHRYGLPINSRDQD